MIYALILNYRDAERTSRCVESLLVERVNRVLIWDNSADGGASAQILMECWKNEDRVSLKISTINLGFAAGVNRGIERIVYQCPEARILLINNDAQLLPGAITLLTQALCRDTQAIIAYPCIDHGGQVMGTVYYQRYMGLITTQSLSGSFPYASGCCMLIASERMQVPLFDEMFFMYGEDIYLGWQLGGKKMTHIPQVLVKHEGSASSRMGSPFYEARIVAAHWLLVHKLSYNRMDYSFLWLGRCFSLTARAIIRSVRYRSFIPLIALVEGWRIAFQRR